MDLLYTDLNIRRLLDAGQAKLNTAGAVKEQSLRGLLRAGSAGCVANGTVYGECHRIGHLRHVGVDKPIAPNRRLMFQAGESNEDIWQGVLVEGWQGTVLRGQQARREGAWGMVLGSPDLVLADESGWRVVLELKLVSALNSAVQRELEGEPDSKHLVQSATYMWLTGCTAVLCYTNRTDFALQFQAKKYGVKKIEPYYRLYYLSFKNDTLWYRDEYSAAEVQTCVTSQGIEAYYTMVSKAATDGLGDRPTNDHVNGAPAAWDRCDSRYCTFADACDRYERSYPTWLDAATRAANEGGG